MVLFFDLSVLSPFTDKSSIPIYTIIGIIFFNFYFIYLIFTTVKKSKKKLSNLRIGPAIIPAIIFGIIKSNFLEIIPRWDSSVYFEALTQILPRFSFSIKSFINNFNWYQHPTMGFYFVESLGQFFSPTNTIAPQIINFFLGLIAIYSFYLIVKYFFPHNDVIENILITTLFTVNPLFLGLSISFLPDYAVLVFFLATYASLIYEKDLLFIFFGVLLVFSKETGIFAYTVLFISYLLLVSLKKWIKSKGIDFSKIIVLLIPFFSAVFYYLTQKGSVWTYAGKTAYNWGSNCQFCFGINQLNVTQNLLIFFVLNFNWILSLFILGSIIKNQILNTRVSEHTSDSKEDLKRIIYYCFIAFVLLFLVYIIYVLPSYLGLAICLISLIFYFSLVNLVKSVRLRKRIIILITLLLFIQSFITVDPISKFAFGTFKIGGVEILKIGTEYLGDGMVYNTQFANVDRLVSKFVSDFNIAPKDTIFMDPYAWGEWYTGWGRFKDSQPKIIFSTDRVGEWPKEMYFVTFPIQYYSNKDEYKVRDGYVAPLIKSDILLKELESKYIITENQKIELDRYWVNVYKLEKNNDK